MPGVPRPGESRDPLRCATRTCTQSVDTDAFCPSAGRVEEWVPAFAGTRSFGSEREREGSPDFDRVVFDDRVGEELLAHILDPGARRSGVGVLKLQLDQLALTHFADAVEAEPFQGIADGLALRIEHAGLQADMHAGLHRRPYCT